MLITAERLSRPVVIHICKDGTITYRRRDQKVFNGVALPVFTVDTEEQARDIQIRFGRRQYDNHPLLPGQPWYRWTDFPGTLEALDDVSDRCDIWYHGYILKQEPAMQQEKTSAASASRSSAS